MKHNRNDQISNAASIIGTLGGSVKSESKSLAARENGKLGGRPKQNEKWTVEHTGKPYADRIPDEAWGLMSTHATLSAACKRMIRERAHCQPNTWDDHYRVLDPNGKVLTLDRFEEWRMAQGKYPKPKRESEF